MFVRKKERNKKGWLRQIKYKEGANSVYFKLAKNKEKKKNKSGPRVRKDGMDGNMEHGLAMERRRWFKTTKTEDEYSSPSDDR